MPKTKTKAKALNTIDALALAHFGDLPGEAFIRVGAIAALFSVSIATIWRRAADDDDDFPAPTKISSGVTAWRVSQIRAALASSVPA